MMNFALDFLGPNGAVLRGYKESGTLDYIGSISIRDHGDGYYEPVGWMAPKVHIWDYHIQAIRYLYQVLPGLVDDFKGVTGTFERNKLRLYERLFRHEYELIKLEDVHKEYNGAILDAIYVWIKPLAVHL